MGAFEVVDLARLVFMSKTWLRKLDVGFVISSTVPLRLFCKGLPMILKSPGLRLFGVWQVSQQRSFLSLAHSQAGGPQVYPW